jgi:signal transduction histidine kinase
MELHDNVKQIIAASQINLEVAKNKLDQKEMLAEILKRVSMYLKDAIHELRRLSHQLAPTVDEEMELTDTISSIVTSMQFNEQCKVITKVDDRLHKKIMSSEVRTAIFRILQEQLTNIHKHAEPTEVLIDVNKSDKGILLKIEDNGKGFDMKQKKEGIGIENIRRRVLFLKGDITIQSAPGKGCKIEASIPL